MAEISVEVGSTVTMSTTSSSEDTDSNSSDLPVAVTTTVIGNGKSNGSTHDGTHDSSNGVKSRKTSDVEADSEKVTQQIAAVAWMVLLGDAIHKFVDGLSVGAAFTENITTGLTLAISVLCEELPHELGMSLYVMVCFIWISMAGMSTVRMSFIKMSFIRMSTITKIRFIRGSGHGWPVV